MGMLFLFNPSHIPVLSACKKEEVKGKKAERASVGTFLLIASLLEAKGAHDCSPCAILNAGVLGIMSNELSSDSTFRANSARASFVGALQLMYKLTLKSFSLPFCKFSNIALVSAYFISKLGLSMPLRLAAYRSALCFCNSLLRFTIMVSISYGSICKERSKSPNKLTILSKKPISTFLG